MDADEQSDPPIDTVNFLMLAMLVWKFPVGLAQMSHHARHVTIWIRQSGINFLTANVNEALPVGETLLTRLLHHSITTMKVKLLP